MKKKEYYDKEFYKEFENRRERIDEINEKESFLREERFKLLRERPWYKKSQNIITLLGVLLPIIITVIISISKKDTKEISIYFEPPESLISHSDNLKGNLNVKYDSIEIKNISRLNIRIINSGTLALTSEDFIDGPLKFMIFNKDNAKLEILEIIKKNDANQQNSKLALLDSEFKNEFTYLPSLLNSGDEIDLEIFLPEKPRVEIKTIGKIKDGNVLKPEILKKDGLVLGFKAFVQSFNSFFYSKWITTLVLIILFIFLALSSFFIFAMTSSGELEDSKVLGILMGLTTTTVSIISIIVLIALLIY